MIIKKGDMFTTELHAIGHGVNCAGVMGAGIAKPIKEKYPNNFANYRAACRRGLLTPGKTMWCLEDGMNIFNMASQRVPGRDAQYGWLFSSTLDAATQAVQAGLDSIAIPMIGCGIGGLEWDYVRKNLETVEYIVNKSLTDTSKFEWEVWMQ